MVARNHKWLVGLILLLLVATLLVVIFDRPPALPTVMILPPSPLAVKTGRAPDRWIPAKWVWLRRACLSLFGQPRQVGFNEHFIEFSGTVASIVAQNSLGPPQAQSNGLAIWILSAGTRKRLNGVLSLGSPSIMTTERTQAQLWFLGYSAELFPRLEKETVDLSMNVFATSTAQTNSVATVCVQLPYGKALFFLDAQQSETDRHRMGFLITADEYDAKGNIISHGQASGK
jgi:hypothetical protein